jgi:outer membrane protein OmpA-like peptidoglycan-associated protein
MRLSTDCVLKIQISTAMTVLLLLLAGVEQAQEQIKVVQPVTQTVEALALTFPEGKTISVKLQGTDRLPQANGEAKVERKKGTTEIEIELDEMKPADLFGGDYNTYVLWSVSPQGLVSNAGEFILNGNRSKLNVSSRLETFGLFVTAEPHFLVKMPSRFVVMQMVRPVDNLQVPLQVAKIEYRGQQGIYQAERESLADAPEAKKEIRSDVGQAETSVRLATAAKADEFAKEKLIAAQISLQKTQEAVRGNVDKKKVAELAKETIRLAYEAQSLSEERSMEASLVAERQAKAEEKARLERESQQSELARAEEERRRAEAEAAQARAQAEQERSRLKAEEAQRQESAARMAAERAQQEKAALRAKLLAQFNAILPTNDSERGLVVNLGDVLFDTGKYTLRQEAVVLLARFSGTVLNYPELSIRSEGHTDSTGSAELNQKLSEQRANAVRDFLISQGLATEKVTSIGRGLAEPVADNQTAAGRQKNRRVELIISGEVIGTKVGTSQ